MAAKQTTKVVSSVALGMLRHVSCRIQYAMRCDRQHSRSSFCPPPPGPPVHAGRRNVGRCQPPVVRGDGVRALVLGVVARLADLQQALAQLVVVL